jgi:hypothetical protein
VLDLPPHFLEVHLLLYIIFETHFLLEIHVVQKLLIPGIYAHNLVLDVLHIGLFEQLDLRLENEGNLHHLQLQLLRELHKRLLVRILGVQQLLIQGLNRSVPLPLVLVHKTIQGLHDLKLLCLQVLGRQLIEVLGYLCVRTLEVLFDPRLNFAVNLVYFNLPRTPLTGPALSHSRTGPRPPNAFSSSKPTNFQSSA